MRSDARKRLTAAREEGRGAEGGVVSGNSGEKGATCPWCPPYCRSCAGDRDCECYSHQDWPDTHAEPDLAPRLARCTDAPGCDGRSHGLDCNNALYGRVLPPAKCVCGSDATSLNPAEVVVHRTDGLCTIESTS